MGAVNGFGDWLVADLDDTGNKCLLLLLLSYVLHTMLSIACGIVCGGGVTTSYCIEYLCSEEELFRSDEHAVVNMLQQVALHLIQVLHRRAETLRIKSVPLSTVVAHLASNHKCAAKDTVR